MWIGLGLAQRRHAGDGRGDFRGQHLGVAAAGRVHQCQNGQKADAGGAAVAVVFFRAPAHGLCGAIYGSLKCFQGSVVALLCGLAWQFWPSVGRRSAASGLKDRVQNLVNEPCDACGDRRKRKDANFHAGNLAFTRLLNHALRRPLLAAVLQAVGIHPAASRRAHQRHALRWNCWWPAA